MTENTVSNLTSIVNEENSITIDISLGNSLIVSSLAIAKHFEKEHKNVLREIERLCSNLPKSFNALNFELVKIKDAKGELRPAYNLTRDGFSLLVMGFTGAAALQWKLKYIKAFNELEKHVFETQTALAHEAGYAQGLDYAASAPALEAREAAAYLKGLKEGQDPKKDRLSKVRKAYGYLQKGLLLNEAAKLVGMHHSTLSDQLQAFGLRHKQTRLKPSTGQASLLQA